MAYQDQFYAVGTVTVTDGSTAVTGAGTGWETALIVGGVFYAGGGAYPIQSVSSETELTLAIPYTGGDAAGAVYAIDRQRAAAISNIAMNDRLAQIIREISIGNIEDLNALDSVSNLIELANLSMVADKLIYGSGNGQLSLTDFSAAARALLSLSGDPAADRLPFLTGANGAGLTPITSFARSILDDTTGSAVWTTLGGSASSSIIKFPNGFMLQRGGNTLPSAGYGTIAFPTAFPNNVYGMVASISEDPGAGYTYTIVARVSTRSNFYGTGHVIQPGTLALAGVTFNWIAWGN